MAHIFGSWESYFYPEPDHHTLRNLGNIRDARELSAYEHQVAAWRELQLREDPSLVRYISDSDHLKSIHEYLFRDAYEWAGRYRTTDMSKGSGMPFASVYNGDIERYLERARQVIAGTPWEVLQRHGCVRALAEIYANIHHAHPFREGNGRAAKLFLEQITLRSPFTLDYHRVSPAQWNSASMLSGPDRGSFEVVPESLVPIFRAIMRERG